MSTIKYPDSRRDDLVEDLHGVKVPDPYRWLEDPKSKETTDFITAQNALFEDYISKFPHTDEYRESLTKTYDYERYGVPFKKGNRWYYSYNEGLKPQSVYYSLDDDAIDSETQGTVFFDPNTLSEDGTLALTTHGWSHDGSLYAYALSQSGSDWCHARIRKVSTGEDYPETINWIKFSSLNFTHDNKGIFYQRFPEPVGVNDAGTETGLNGNAKIYYHLLGTDQSEDILIYTDPDHSGYFFDVRMTFDGNWLQLSISQDTAPTNKLWIAKVQGGALPADGKLEWIKIKDDFDSGLGYFANNGNIFYFESNDEAPNSKVVRYDLDNPNAGFITIVPEQPHAVLKNAALTNEKYLLLQYLHNVQDKIFIVPLDSVENNLNCKVDPNANGEIRVEKSSHDELVDGATGDEWIGIPEAEQLDLPVGCAVSSTKSRRDNPRIFISCVGYTLAGRVYQYKFHSVQSSQANGTFHKVKTLESKSKRYGQLSVWRESIVDGFEPDRWAVDQVWVPNPNDGVKIPMFIVHDKFLVKSGNSFCLLYGYGGFNVSLTPSFSPNLATMLTHSGGVYCVANIRGGGEFGDDWHKGAIREKRPVAFADFEECGRYLIRERWTRKEKLICQGGSNGGALIGAVMNRAGEEIFAAGIAQVGVLDLLRYHLFTIGYAWKPDYGDPDVKEDFEFIYKWSPYHNVRDGKSYQYPAILCETSDHDDRVSTSLLFTLLTSSVPLHSFKFIAALQYAAGKTNDAPLLLRHHLKAGHGAGKPTKKVIEEASERFAFMMVSTGSSFVPNMRVSRSSRI